MSVLTRAVEFRADEAGEGDGRTLSGYAAVFNSPTEIDSWEGRFVESIERGAFADSIARRTPVVQFNHGKDPRVGELPIASVQALREDDRGLYVSARLYEHAEAVREAIAGGSITGMSFRFRVLDDEWGEADGMRTRSIRKVELYELGPVVHPAYADTSVGVRSDPLGDPEAVRRLQKARIDLLRAQFDLLAVMERRGR
ncbi:HK97 family phage prohead protease [Streptomyces sp. S1A]|uniref:HK97 family phage prohead protease n=1 Tax=Streptomyces sp. ICN903 TaxID=2964654 RepID=UPI001EDC3C23|nr:HK97 family phage prohead protease [Streptomyces sp. ICN903]MCG3042567.1 HK97 family phage prohead protease [Streptomyces sp. ICN903]